MTSAEPMTERAAHYTALLETIEHQGVASLHGRERDQLMEAADGLLFGEQGSEQRLRVVQDLIESLEATPDTVVTLTSGNKLLVRDSMDEVREKIIEFKRRVHGPDARPEGG